MLAALGARIIPPVRMQEPVNLHVHVGLLGARIIPRLRWPPVRMQEARKPTCACGTARLWACWPRWAPALPPCAGPRMQGLQGISEFEMGLWTIADLPCLQ